MKELKGVKDVKELEIQKERLFHSASHEEILKGITSDIYFIKAREILTAAGREKTPVTAEIFSSKPGVFAGAAEASNLLKAKNVSVWSLEEGDEMAGKEVVMRISGPYDEFGIYETALLGMLASASSWASAARECKDAAGSKPVFSFGARHIHPAVAPVMERAAVIGGADNCSCILGAKLMGNYPVGTVPHAAILVIGDTVETALIYDQVMPSDSPRIILVDTLKDEVEESLRVAAALKEKLNGVRLDTPGERGGVTPSLVKEVRANLDQAGFSHVQIFVSGGITAERIPGLKDAGADAFGVGSYIADANPINMTMDLKEIEGSPRTKRGRIPGITNNIRLKKIQ